MLKFKCGIDNDLSKPIIVGKGTSFVLSGWCFHYEKLVKKIEIIVDDQGFIANSIQSSRFDVLKYQTNNDVNEENSVVSGFWGIVNISPIDYECKKEIQLKVTLVNNEEYLISIGTITLIPNLKRRSLSLMENNFDNSLISICMATYNPDLQLFRRQIKSIINQTYKNWICIINDDCSKQSIFEEIREVIKNDSRFFIYRNTKNLGFYKNFEKTLTYVPKQSTYIALSDQDDVWHKNKLEKIIELFDEKTSLVYSDMKIVKENGSIISDTYWSDRKNHYRDLNALLLANTITGAASVFKRELLDTVLPFPEKVGDSFHDWWIGLCAFMSGEIKYIDAPLYDYVQHGSNVIGQSRGVSLTSGLKKLLGEVKTNSKHEIKRFIKHGKAIYDFDYKRVLLTTNILHIRFQGIATQKKINQLIKFKRSLRIPTLSGMYIKNRFNKIDTVHAELRLILGLSSDKILKKIYIKRKKTYLQNSISLPNVQIQKNELSIDHLFQKIAPLKIKISNNQKERINIVIPTIDFKYFFGGYIGKFNLAQRLAKSGYSVRLLIIDYAEFNLDDWKQSIKKYDGLENFFDYVEVEYFFDRSNLLIANSKDKFIATTWWTAYVVNEAIKEFEFNKFIYLIQEYESLTFEHGSYFALANESYNFNHYALFSTELLREYFKLEKIGVYKNDSTQGDLDSIAFENAILSFDISEDDLNKKNRKKKLAFYARPESHASRNMFEMGILALNKAIEMGTFDDEWEFYGMGSVSNYNGIKINEDTTMKILPKMSLDKYKETLKDFDIGISLMYTPHPSLVPQEMASAGMLVVTNSYANKTEEKLKNISTNFIVAKPTISDVAQKIKYAVEHVNDIHSRFVGSNVNWSSNWEETFNSDFIEKINTWIR